MIYKNVNCAYNLHNSDEKVYFGLVYKVLLEKLQSSKKNPSLIPLITVSKTYLCECGLWENTIRMYGMTRDKYTLYYNGKMEFGKKLHDNIIGRQVDVKNIKFGIIILLGSLKEWTDQEQMPDNVIPISLSENRTVHDEHVILMITSNQNKTVPCESLWTSDFVTEIQNQFIISMKGDDKKT